MSERPRTTSQMPPSDALVPESRRLGRYEIVYRAARGGMATVYLARLSTSMGFSKWVAIKTIHPHVSDEPRYVTMFLDEARLAARIDHPNVCTVFDFGESDGTYYLAMEYLHGLALSSVLKRVAPFGGMPFGIGARIVADAARGLHAAHELRGPDGKLAGVVHRDCSPQNVFVLYDGISKVVDFGIAKSNDQHGERTRTTELKGKIAYMAPEQVNQSLLDRRADIWALGVVLWESTLSRRLFQRPNDLGTLHAVAYEEIPRPSTVRPDYPPALEAIVMRALARDPAQRYATAADLARDLEVFLASLPDAVTSTEVGAFMHRHFARDLEARNEALRVYERSAAQNVPTTAPSAPASTAGTRAVSSTDPPPTPSHPIPPPPPPRAQPAAIPSAQSFEHNVLAIPPSPKSAPVETLITRDPRAPSFDFDQVPPPPATRSDGSGALFTAVLLVALAGGGYVASTMYRTSRAPVNPAAGARDATSMALRPLVPVSTDAAADAARGDAATIADATGTMPAANPSRLPTGALEIVSTAAARVYDRERLLGETPLVHAELPVGMHTLRIVPIDGRAPRVITVNIRAGRTTARRERW